MDILQLEEIKNIYLKLNDNCNEENIKIKVVAKILKILGYEETWIHFEKNVRTGRADIAIEHPKNNVILYIETKRKNYKISKKDIDQLISYLVSSNISWGILTNGNKYLLLNKDIKGKGEDKVVLEYELFFKSNTDKSKKQNNINLTYFSYENLFVKKSTKYFSYFKDFVINNNLKSISIRNYQSANYTFYNFLNENERVCDNNLLSPSKLEYHLESLLSKYNYSKKTLLNKSRYITCVMKYLEDSQILTTKNFTNYKPEKFINNTLFNTLENKSKIFKPLTQEEVNLLIEHYSHNKSKYYRNKVLLKLYLFICPNMGLIKNLKMNDLEIDNDRITIKINSVDILLPSGLSKDLKEYLSYRKDNNIKTEYLFYTIYRKKENPFTNSTLDNIINRTVNEVKGISSERKKEFNIALIQKSVITQMIQNGFTIEEISSFTDISYSTLENYIDDKTLNQYKYSAIKKLSSKKHPYCEIFI